MAWPRALFCNHSMVNSANFRGLDHQKSVLFCVVLIAHASLKTLSGGLGHPPSWPSNYTGRRSSYASEPFLLLSLEAHTCVNLFS